MDYKMISADDHLDLQYLPTDLWTKHLPKALRHRVPYIEERNGGAVWVCDGEVWGRWAGTRRPTGPKAHFNAFDWGPQFGWHTSAYSCGVVLVIFQRPPKPLIASGGQCIQHHHAMHTSIVVDPLKGRVALLITIMDQILPGV